MLQAAARRSLSLLSGKASCVQAACMQARSYSLDGVKGFSDHETAVENMYFNKEDERVLRKLLGKIKQQAEQDTSAAAHHAAAEEAALRAIVAKYSVSDLDIKALLEWKHATY